MEPRQASSPGAVPQALVGPCYPPSPCLSAAAQMVLQTPFRTTARSRTHDMAATSARIPTDSRLSQGANP